MEPAPQRRAYQTLDGLRAVGAFMVVMRHVPYLFGPIKVPESFLAVDLFYLVSGFVVAHAYGQRLSQGGFFVEFVKTRLIRLYPLYAVGLAVGVVVALVSIIGDPKGWWTWTKLAEAIASGLFMVPLFPGLGASGGSLDGPVWTLLPELIANFVYAAAIRFMTTRVLLAIVLVCGAGVAFAELHYGTLDVGYNRADQWAALARVGFSFFAGVLVFRVSAKRERRSAWLSLACLAGLAGLLAYDPSDDAVSYYELAVVLVGFPLLLAAAAAFEPCGLTGRAFAFLGLMSYGVYLLHQPMGNLARLALQPLVKIPPDWTGVAFGAVFLVLVTAFAWALDVHYDAPLRRWLRKRLMAKA
jgi:peptidoglycan/LPS O-acetylase OafA/YrhL